MKLSYVFTGVLVILLTGCSNKQRQAEQDAFFPDQRSSPVKKLAYTQAANGARGDGMLYPMHFNGNELTPLGKQKLSLMLGDDAAAKPLTVYMVNVGAGDQLDKRKTAVREFLKDGLRPDEKLEFVNGQNENTLRPSAETMARMQKVETSTEGGAAGGGSGAAANSMGLGLGK